MANWTSIFPEVRDAATTTLILVLKQLNTSAVFSNKSQSTSKMLDKLALAETAEAKFHWYNFIWEVAVSLSGNTSDNDSQRDY